MSAAARNWGVIAGTAVRKSKRVRSSVVCWRHRTASWWSVSAGDRPVEGVVEIVETVGLDEHLVGASGVGLSGQCEG